MDSADPRWLEDAKPDKARPAQVDLPSAACAAMPRNCYSHNRQAGWGDTLGLTPQQPGTARARPLCCKATGARPAAHADAVRRCAAGGQGWGQPAQAGHPHAPSQCEAGGRGGQPLAGAPRKRGARERGRQRRKWEHLSTGQPRQGLRRALARAPERQQGRRGWAGRGGPPASLGV